MTPRRGFGPKGVLAPGDGCARKRMWRKAVLSYLTRFYPGNRMAIELRPTFGKRSKLARGEVFLRVSLFITCYNDTLFPETGKAVVQVLERLGHTVDFPAGQTCCGQMHWNTGYQEEGYPLLRRFVEQFRNSEAVVSPSTSCVAMMRDHYPL